MGIALRKQQEVPTITVSHLVTTGTTVTLHSSISTSTPLSSVSWNRSSSHGDIPVEVNGSKYSGATVDSPSLVINNVSKKDTGKYTCCATNSKGKGQSYPVYVSADEDEDGIPVVTMVQTKHIATEGEIVILQCSVTSQPPAKKISWEKNGENIVIDNMKYIGGSLDSPSLAITRTEKCSDEGEYFCKAQNASKSAKSQKVTLEISSGKPNVNYESVSEQIEDRRELEGVEKSIKQVSVDMVSALSKSFTPSLKEPWGDLQLQLTVHMNDDASIYGTDVTDFRVIWRNMLKKGVITDRRYDVLYNVVESIDVRAAEIIEKASLKIKQLEEGGMPDTKSVTFIVPVGGDIDNISSESKIHIQNNVANELKIPKERVKVEFSIKGLVIISFEFCGAVTRVEPSALYIATMLKERLKQGRIQMTDESNSPLPLRPNDGVIHTKDKPVATVNRADVSICYGKYVKTEGQNAVLDCVVSASPKATTVTWVRIVNGGEVTIRIDNEKYIGASVNSPSLTIADLTTGDQGAYYCKVNNEMGDAESNTTMLHVTRLKSKSIQKTKKCLKKVRESLDKWLQVGVETEQMCERMHLMQAAQQLQLDNKLGGYVCSSVCVTLICIYLPLALPVGGFAIGVAFATSKVMREKIIRNFEIKESLLQDKSKDLLTGITDFTNTKSVSEMEIGENDLLSDDTLLGIFSELSTEITAYHNHYMSNRSDARIYLDMLHDLQIILNLLRSCMEQMERWVDGYGERMTSDTMYR